MDFDKLVNECLQGSSIARKQLYEQFARQMYTVCMRYARNKDDADDIFHQSFLNVFEKLNQLRNPKALPGWIKSVFVNTSLAYGREHYKSSHTTQALPDEVAWHADMNKAVEKMALDDLTKLIQQLSDQYRKVFNLYIIDGFSHKEIADKLEISVGTSKSNFHDARKILQQKIKMNNTLGK